MILVRYLSSSLEQDALEGESPVRLDAEPL
uniref:Uncharacterized protein n=1 Tax=Rhizophora mucronata TaxID=61149 RepID=A0A2P2NBR8_RHIMU